MMAAPVGPRVSETRLGPSIGPSGPSERLIPIYQGARGETKRTSGSLPI